MKEHHRCTGGQAQHQFASHRILPDENLFLVALKLFPLGSGLILSSVNE
jgi:hypothetical protein